MKKNMKDSYCILILFTQCLTVAEAEVWFKSLVQAGGWISGRHDSCNPNLPARCHTCQASIPGNLTYLLDVICARLAFQVT